MAPLTAAGGDLSAVARLEVPTAHAIINVDDAAENAIVLFAGANAAQQEVSIAKALVKSAPGDTLLLQNETTLQPFANKLALERGLSVVFSAAPFNVDAAAAMPTTHEVRAFLRSHP